MISQTPTPQDGSDDQFRSSNVPNDNFRPTLSNGQVSIVIGPPGSGKGTHAKIMQDQFDVVHISTGQLLRNAAAQDTPLGRAVKPYTDTGRLAPDELVIAVMENRIMQPDCAEGFILDGFPRTVAQAEALTEMLNKKGVTAPRVIELVVSDEEAVRRINSRGQTSGRADDTEVVARQRLEIYHEETEPILAYYRGRQRVHIVDGEGTIEEVSVNFVQLFESPET